jgi:hypothetical protein
MIKEKENQQNQQGQGNGGNCPGGGQGQGSPGAPKGSIPSGQGAKDFGLPDGINAGQVDPKAIEKIAQVWGILPEKERAKAMLELTRDLDPRYREAIEVYIKELARRSEGNKP